MRWIIEISGYSILIPLLCGVIYFKSLSDIHKKFLWFILFSTFFEAAVTYVGVTYGNNLWMFKVFLICDFIFFVWFFNKIYPYSLIDRVVVAVVVLFLLTDYFILQTYFSINDRVSLFHLTFFLFFIYQSAYIITKTFDNVQGNILRNYIFWIAFARLFYYLIIVFIFIYPNFVSSDHNNEFYDNADATINSVANILLNILYAISFTCLKVKNSY